MSNTPVKLVQSTAAADKAAGAQFLVMNNGLDVGNLLTGVDTAPLTTTKQLVTTGPSPYTADVVMTNAVCLLSGAGVPTDATTGATFAGPGSLYVDITNANLYINGNTKASPTWKLVTRAA